MDRGCWEYPWIRPRGTDLMCGCGNIFRRFVVSLCCVMAPRERDGVQRSALNPEPKESR
jgi:hypothetical protein